MNFVGPTRFAVTYTPTTKSILCPEGKPRFSGEFTSTKPKIYIYSRDGVPLYVGATVSSMGTRMGQGWRASGKNGFYGYSFRHEGEQIDLDVWVDTDPIRERTNGRRSGSDRETVEAEVVYLLRHRTGHWPEHQTEIHFYRSEPEHRDWAEKILSNYRL